MGQGPRSNVGHAFTLPTFDPANDSNHANYIPRMSTCVCSNPHYKHLIHFVHTGLDLKPAQKSYSFCVTPNPHQVRLRKGGCLPAEDVQTGFMPVYIPFPKPFEVAPAGKLLSTKAPSAVIT